VDKSDTIRPICKLAAKLKPKKMKHKLLLIYLVILVGCTKNKNSEINNNNIAQKFPAEGWKIVGSCSTDFNNDKIIDKAYVIQENKTTVSKDDECIGESFNRKELIIKFGQNSGEYKTNYKTSKVFGKCNWGIQGTDAFGKIGNRKNTLKLSFSTGGTLRSSLSYYFRYQDGDWFLIGYDEMTYQVPYEDKYIKEINYLTGMQESYEIIDGKSSQPEISNIGKAKLLKLSELDASTDNSAGEE
jgi:hypothetical protein